MSDIIIIVIVLAAGYWLVKEGKLQEIMGSFGLGGGNGADGADGLGNGADGLGNGIDGVDGADGIDIDVSGPGAGACVNGVCKGNPESIRKAQEMLEMINN